MPPLARPSSRAVAAGSFWASSMEAQCRLRSDIIQGTNPTLCSVNWKPNELGSFLRRIVLKQESSSYIGSRDGDSVELGKGESQGSV
jgi:hypothetical protein